MRQEQFETENQALWDQLVAMMEELERPRSKRRLEPAALAAFPGDYRRLCSHYALARSRGFSPMLVEYLHRLVLRGHPLLYKRASAWGWRLLNFVLFGFPQAFRRHLGAFSLSLLFFLLPALLMGTACYLQEDMIYSVMEQKQVSGMESAYDPDNDHLGRSEERSSETDFQMFGYYILNNIGIGFRTFALGILLGVGTLFILIFNGVVIGGVAGHLTRLGYLETFWPFVAGHGAFELTAIVICGGAGLLMGRAVVAPGPQGRLETLKANALEALQLVMGAALMLVVAAFIEAFWSSSTLAPDIKYGVAALLWLTVILYLSFMGRGARGSR
jgi:uncharacterized membrane protein SpoIIM required for sporulation